MATLFEWQPQSGMTIQPSTPSPPTDPKKETVMLINVNVQTSSRKEDMGFRVGAFFSYAVLKLMNHLFWWILILK
jgi:hypothetical protein